MCAYSDAVSIMSQCIYIVHLVLTFFLWSRWLFVCWLSLRSLIFFLFALGVCDSPLHSSAIFRLGCPSGKFLSSTSMCNFQKLCTLWGRNPPWTFESYSILFRLRLSLYYFRKLLSSPWYTSEVCEHAALDIFLISAFLNFQVNPRPWIWDGIVIL